MWTSITGAIPTILKVTLGVFVKFRFIPRIIAAVTRTGDKSDHWSFPKDRGAHR